MNVRKYTAELLGTFVLALTVFMCIFNKVSADIQPLAIGLCLTALVYVLGHSSGAHLNPAVTLAVILRGRISPKEGIFYIVAQILGSLAAFGLAYFLVSPKGVSLPPLPTLSIFQALTAEILGAFILTYTILNVATAKSLEGNNFYGSAIGFSKVGALYAFGSISGSVFNPAISLSLCLAGLANWQFLWVYLVGALLGAAIAVFIFKFINPDD